MKRKGFFIIFMLCILLVGCGVNPFGEKLEENWRPSKEPYLTTMGYSAKLSGDYLVMLEEGLHIIDLSTKEIIKEIELPHGFVGGFAISGTRIVWSAYSNEGEAGKDYFYDESTNTDIFLYDIIEDTTVSIATNSSGQIAPDIWGDYIVWQDNRNDKVRDQNPEWDIILYHIPTKEEKLITTAPGSHTNPKINDNIVVWEDGRNFTGESHLRWGSNVPENNTDIFLYQILTGEERAVATGKLQECHPSVYGNYILWEDRSKNGLDADIILYDIENSKETRITDGRHNQAYPQIYDRYIIWMDERNGISTNDVIMNNKMPNSDIFLYDLEEKKEYLLTGEEPQIMPVISEKYIAYITSRQVDPEIVLIKYK